MAHASEGEAWTDAAPDAAGATAAARRVAAVVENAFRGIASTRMAGLPLCHPGLEVAAVGFEPDVDGGGVAGVLITPWFMNLVWVPLEPPSAPPADGPRGAPPRDSLPPGDSRARRIGAQVFDFLGAYEDGLGPYESCSLFSPMFDFADQAAARATAEAVVSLLRPPGRRDAPCGQQPGRGEAPASDASPVASRAQAAPGPARRAFLFGRGGVP